MTLNGWNVHLYYVILSHGDYILMADKLMTLLVGLLIALGGWSLSRTFELSTIQAVHEDKVQVLREQVLKLEEQMDKMMDLDEDIMDQHKRLFKILEKGDTPSGSYNY